LVLVDVTVTKDGKFISDLTKEDFELYEDGVKMPINSFELMSFAERKPTPLEETQEKSSLLPKKKLVVLFDGINTWQRYLKQGAESIIKELVELVKLGNEVMIIQLGRKKGVKVLQAFTSDEELIGRAVAKAAGDIWVDKSLDAMMMAQEVGVESSGEQEQARGMFGKSTQIKALMTEYLDIKKQRFEKTIGGLLAVFNMIKDMPGRKSLLFVSEGLPELSQDVRGLFMLSQTSQIYRKDYEIDPFDTGGRYGFIKVADSFNILDKKGFMRGDEIIKKLISFANAQNIAIYTLSPGTFTHSFFTEAVESDAFATLLKKQEKMNLMQSLRMISEDTGAAWLRGDKKYDNFREIMNTDLNFYYQLSYYPPRKTADNNYHKIEVKVKRSGINIRCRSGYTDFSEEEKAKMFLISAFYNPDLYKALPFEAEFIPFHVTSDTYKPWMNIALPAKELFKERGVAYGLQQFDLQVWIKDRKEAGGLYNGQIAIPLNIDGSFMNLVERTDYFCFHWIGPEIEFKKKEYEVIFALYDEQTEEIGTWVSSFSLPDKGANKQATIINLVLGALTSNPEGEDENFSLSKKRGSLEYGKSEFFPEVAGQFRREQDASVFLQVYLPQGKTKINYEFSVLQEGRILQKLSEEIVAEDWNKKSNVWSGIFILNLGDLLPGDYTLRVNLHSTDTLLLSKDVKLMKLYY